MAREEGFFDELARGLADGSLTRGKALRLMGAALVGGTLGSLGIGEASADAPGCKRNGKHCTRNTQCCGNLVCVSGTCQEAQTTTTTTTPTISTSTTPMCIPLGIGPCNDPDQCCGLSACEGGTCCASGNQVCNADSECCGDFTCQEGQCLPVCLQDSEACIDPRQCCSGNCVNGTCVVCQSTGGQCDTDSQCCTGACLNGTCCIPNDSQCTTDTECCNGNCFNGFCEPRNRIQCGCENGAAGACTSTDCSDATAVNQLCTDLCAQLGQGAVPERSECIPEGCVS